MTTRPSAPLPIPHKDPMAVKIARAVARRVRNAPRSSGEARERFETFVDKRVVGNQARREQLVRQWGKGAALARRVPGGAAMVERSSLSLSRRLAGHHHPEDARAVLLAARGSSAGRTDGSVTLAARAAVLDLSAGRSVPDVDALVRRSLELADAALDARDHDAAGSHLQDAFDLAFHRTFHFEDTPSPYAADPDAFLAPFRESAAFRRATTPTARTPRPAAEPAGRADRPHRVLFATATNFNFARDIIDAYEARDDVEVREVDVRRLGQGAWRPTPLDLTRNRLRHADGIAMQVPAEYREDFDWADTVFVEWGHRAMVWASMLPDLRARVVARLHSYEALTPFPLITDWSGVDDLVFVSGHIRNLVEHAVPAVLEGPRRHTLGNRNDLSAYDRPKRYGASHTLGLIGWSQVVKDPLWALDVLEELRKDDPRWRIRLIGNEFGYQTALTAPAERYREELERRIEALGEAVVRPGYTSDVPHALRRVGVILSTSHREGTHEGLIQGAASGALPVVRNWPVVARWGGARTMFPDEWVVETPAEAADRIRAAVAEGQGDVLAATQASKDWVVAHYDWSVIGPRLDAVIINPEGPRA